jgi:hypothetical protein
VDFGVHPTEQSFGRRRRDPRPLKLPDFLPLAPDLDAHVFDTRLMKSRSWHFGSVAEFE